jgi:diamine N-acetyltransferase
MSHFLESTRILLRPIQREDLKYLAELMSDREIGILTGEVYPSTEKGMEEFYERCQKTEDRIWFVIVDKETGKVIGETGFLRMFMPWRTTDFSLVIWDKEYWSKGYGKEIAALMLEYGFNSLNIHRMAIGVVGFNQNALKLWKSIGFVEEGRQKDGYFVNGEYSDFVMLYLLEDDYRNRPKSQ